MTNAEIGYKGTKPMEIKKAKPATPATDAFSVKKAAEFVGDIKLELKKINWTSWEELKVYTQIVVAATFIFGMGLYITDLTIQSVLSGLEVLVRLISG